jgi:hypothetical protein
MPRVVTLDTRVETDLAGARSQEGRQMEMFVLGWSPDSQRVAAYVRGQGRQVNGTWVVDWDL